MKQYLDLMQHVLDNGIKKEDRTGTGTRSVFGYQMRFNLEDGFPVITTKKVHLRSIVYELLWFLNGDTNIKYLKENKVSIWDDWADKNGELGPVYGHQWRSWPTSDGETVDQISEVVKEIKTNPDSRRLIVSAWNVAEIKNMALPPCHAFFQFYVANGRLSCQLYQRSADIFLGVPFNIASYSLLTLMMAQVCDLRPGEYKEKVAVDNKHTISRVASLDNLNELREFVVEAAIAEGLNPDEVFTFKLVTEEICTNIIQYSYEGSEAGEIKLSFERHKTSAILKIIDSGQYFSPDDAKTPDLQADWDEREIGGLGIFIVEELMDVVSYKKIDGNLNQLTLEKQLSSSYS